MEAAVDAAGGHQFFMRAVFDEAALVEDQYEVRCLGGGQAVGDADQRPALGKAP